MGRRLERLSAKKCQRRPFRCGFCWCACCSCPMITMQYSWPSSHGSSRTRSVLLLLLLRPGQIFFFFFLYLARRDVMTLAHLENGRWRETRELCFVVLSSAATASLKREEKWRGTRPGTMSTGGRTVGTGEIRNASGSEMMETNPIDPHGVVPPDGNLWTMP